MTASTRWRGLIAALLLAATTVGLPLALAVTEGDPLRSWPSLRSGQLSDTDMIAVLAAVFWLAWITFVVPVAVEAVVAVAARIAHRPLRHVRLPLLGAQQHLARQLISAVLLLLPAATSALAGTTLPAAHPLAHTTATAWSTTEPTASDAPPVAGHAAPHGPLPTYRIPEVGGLRSYWALAEHYLGDGARWREIWQLNEGRVHSDGTVMDSPRQLHVGWTILLPPAAIPTGMTGPPASTHDVRVAPGDTLSGLSAADGILDWQRAWRLNADRPEPDGQRYTDPDLIRPGWTLTLPGASSRRSDPTTSTGRHGSGPTVTGDPRQHHPPALGRASTPQSATPPLSENADPAPTAPTLATSTPSRAAAANDNHHDGEHHRLPAVPLEIGLAAAAAVVALDRARRIAQRRRRVGHRPLPPPPELSEVEAEIRRDSRRTHPTIAAIELATALSGTHPVTVHTVIARSDGAVDLHLTEETPPAPPPPPPFLAVTGGWRLPAGADAFSFALDPDDLDDPCPALIPVGTTLDGQVLVNLAATGPVGITGEPDIVDGYLRQIITALAGAPWADRVQLDLPPRMAAQFPSSDRLTVEDSLRPQPAAATPHTPDDPPGGEEPGWRTTPIHLYVGWGADAELDPLLQAYADPQRHLHLLLNGTHPATTTWTLQGDQLTVPGLIEPVTVTLPAPVGPSASDLLHYTVTAPEVPAGDPRLPDLTAPPSNAEAPNNKGSDNEPRRLLLLGPVELTGTGRLRRSQVLNLLTFLAMHPRGVDRHQLLAALWPDQAPSLQTMRNRISESRRLVDGGITDGPIWRLTDTVTTDWAQFTALAAGNDDERRRALQLVRGRPFTGLDDADWIDLEGIRSEVEAAIVDLALTVADHDLDAGNHPGALEAARAGLAASRYEERLHRAAIRAAMAQGLHGVAKTLQHEMRVALDLDVEPDDQIQAETITLLQEARDRRSVVVDGGSR